MYYINETANESGNHGNPVSRKAEGMVGLPDSLLTAYLETMGFATLTVEKETVTAVAINHEAYDAYQADHKETPPTAGRDYEAGEYLNADGKLYRVLLPIFAGTQLTPGTNVTETTIEAGMAALNKEE